jgi:hypothetical protein
MPRELARHREKLVLDHAILVVMVDALYHESARKLVQVANFETDLRGRPYSSFGGSGGGEVDGDRAGSLVSVVTGSVAG